MTIAEVRRNGVVEAEHHVAYAASDATGRLLVAAGDVDRRYFVRSAAKPVQAAVVREIGVSLTPEQWAIACSSHGGLPGHLAYVRSILSQAGLDESALQTPPAWPLAEAGRDAAIRSGATGPARIFHNCSGKHAAMLAACRAAGWTTDDYLHADHPLQVRIRATWERVADAPVDRLGVDGCGAPVFTVSTRDLARVYAEFGNNEAYRPLWWAMHRFPALASENGRIDARIATAMDAAAKIGAEGCVGVAVRNGPGAAAKCWDGSNRGLEAGIIGCLRGLGMAVGNAAERLETAPVLGGGSVQGGVTIPAVERVG